MSNYTEEETQYIIEQYNNNPTLETVYFLAESMNKPAKSIIGKLAREGVYQRQSYKTKTGEDPVTKVQLVSEIVDRLEIEEQLVAGLEKAPKSALKALLEAISEC
ncbi:MAG: hypothetical protein VW518_00405 [Burkholderiaceae bacterium]